MAIIRQSPRVFTSTSTAPFVSSSSGSNFQFGFRPTYLRIENLGTVDIWAKFGATTTATTGEAGSLLIRACEASRVLELHLGREIGVDVVSLNSTSTVANGVSILAMGPRA